MGGPKIPAAPAAPEAPPPVPTAVDPSVLAARANMQASAAAAQGRAATILSGPQGDSSLATNTLKKTLLGA